MSHIIDPLQRHLNDFSPKFLTKNQAIQPFVDETTKSKIHMVKDHKKHDPLAEIAEPSQYEVDFGGTDEYTWDYERDRLLEDREFPPNTRAVPESAYEE